MDGTGDETKLRLFNPKQSVFYYYERVRKDTPPGVYQRDDKHWVCFRLNPHGIDSQLRVIKLINAVNMFWFLRG